MFARLVLCSLLSPAALLAQSSPHAGPTLLVANQKDHTLSLVDPVTNRQFAAVDVGGYTGHEVTASPDGRTAFVPIYGDSGVGKAGTDGHSIAVIDLATHQVTHTIDFPHGVRPHLPRFDPAGHTLFVSTELDDTLTEIDPHSLRIVGALPTSQPESHMFVFSHDGKRIYTANVGPGTVSVLDVATQKPIAVIPIAKETQRIAISNDDSMIFTSDQTKPQMAVIDTATNRVKTWIPLPATGYGAAATLDGNYLLVTLRSLHQVAVVDLKTLKVARTIAVPGTPVEILVRPTGSTAYVSCGKQVAVIDTANWTIPAVIDAGTGADGLAWAR
jgi:YVTN family beta-propeller protein